MLLDLQECVFSGTNSSLNGAVEYRRCEVKVRQFNRFASTDDVAGESNGAGAGSEEGFKGEVEAVGAVKGKGQGKEMNKMEKKTHTKTQTPIYGFGLYIRKCIFKDNSGCGVKVVGEDGANNINRNFIIIDDCEYLGNVGGDICWIPAKEETEIETEAEVEIEIGIEKGRGRGRGGRLSSTVWQYHVDDPSISSNPGPDSSSSIELESEHVPIPIPEWRNYDDDSTAKLEKALLQYSRTLNESDAIVRIKNWEIDVSLLEQTNVATHYMRRIRRL